MELPVLQGLPLLLRFVLQVIPFFQAAQHQAIQDMLAGLLDQLLKQPQRHDADLGTGKKKKRLSSSTNAEQHAKYLLTDIKQSRQWLFQTSEMIHLHFV